MESVTLFLYNPELMESVTLFLYVTQFLYTLLAGESAQTSTFERVHRLTVFFLVVNWCMK